MHNEQKETAFEVKDRRRFNPDGTPREGDADQEKEPVNPPSRPEAPQQGAPKEASSQTRESSFTTFILSLATSVQIALGLIPHPMTGNSEIDLAGAKQTIDILGMLQEKTKGNLRREEERILGQVLFELRMQYVEIARQRKK